MMKSTVTKHPKPFGKAGRKAIVYSIMWAKPGRRLFTFHSEEKIYFDSCGQARAWAAKHGFDGVKFDLPEGERHG
jgi:hypothetical protein